MRQPNDTTGAETLAKIDKLARIGLLNKETADSLREVVGTAEVTIQRVLERSLPAKMALQTAIDMTAVGTAVALNPPAVGHLVNWISELQAANVNLASVHGLVTGLEAAVPLLAPPSPQDSAAKTLAHLLSGKIQPDVARVLRDAAEGAFAQQKRRAAAG